MAPAIILALIVGVGINLVLDYGGWLFFVIKGILVCLVYLLLVFVLALTKEEVQSVKKTIKGFVGKLNKKSEN